MMINGEIVDPCNSIGTRAVEVRVGAVGVDIANRLTNNWTISIIFGEAAVGLLLQEDVLVQHVMLFSMKEPLNSTKEL